MSAHNLPHHLWYSGSEDAIRAYYRTTGGVFLCPNCHVFVADFDNFKAQHRNASAFITKSKKALTREVALQGSISPHVHKHISTSARQNNNISSMTMNTADDNIMPTPPPPEFADDDMVPPPPEFADDIIMPPPTDDDDDDDDIIPPPPEFADINDFINSPAASQYVYAARPPHPPPPQVQVGAGAEGTLLLVVRALRDGYKDYIFTPNDTQIDIAHMIETNKREIESKASEVLNGSYKIQLTCKVVFKNAEGNTKEWFLSNRADKYHANFLTNGAHALQEKIQNYSNLSSGWSVNNIIQLSFRCVKYTNF